MKDPISLQISYKKRLVAFLDVMGFKNMLGSDPNSLEKLQHFYRTATDLRNFLGTDEQFSTKEYDFQSIFVSDAIVLSIEVPKDNEIALQATCRFLQNIAMLQAVLALDSKVWVRGAITLGDLFIDQERNILVGPAFVRAYNLESTADFPRVIVDPQVCRHFNLIPSEFITKINAIRSKTLMGPTNGMRWGGAVWMNDAMQVDWFFAAASMEKMDFEPYFSDLRLRMTQDQSIFHKAFKLLAYFRESLSEIEARKEKDRLIKLDIKLKEFNA